MFRHWSCAGGFPFTRFADNPSAYGLFFFSSRRRHTRWNCDWSSDGVLFRSQSRRDQPMTGSTTDGRIDRLVKAGWLEIGLSQSDLAEVLDAVLESPSKHGGDP